MSNTKPSFKDILNQSKGKSLDKKEDKKEETKETKEESKETKKSSSKSNQVLTKGGYDAFEVMSALQKSIRRGQEEFAMFWALEMEETNPSWLWKRLMIMSTEDVGIADPSVCTTVKTMWDTYEKMKEMAKGKKPESHILGMAVLSLCRAPKNHEVLYFPMVVNWWRKYLDWKIEIPDYALDVHTKRGKKMGRGRNHWYSEGLRVDKKVEISGDKYETAFRRGDEIKYNLEDADDFYYYDHEGHYEKTEEDTVIDADTGLPLVGEYDKNKV